MKSQIMSIFSLEEPIISMPTTIHVTAKDIMQPLIITNYTVTSSPSVLAWKIDTAVKHDLPADTSRKRYVNTL